MGVEEWLSLGLGEMQVLHLELETLLQMTERLSSQPCLSGLAVSPMQMDLLEELARCSCFVKTAWLSYACQIGTWIGQDGRPAGLLVRP